MAIGNPLRYLLKSPNPGAKLFWLIFLSGTILVNPPVSLARSSVGILSGSLQGNWTGFLLKMFPVILMMRLLGCSLNLRQKGIDNPADVFQTRTFLVPAAIIFVCVGGGEGVGISCTSP